MSYKKLFIGLIGLVIIAAIAIPIIIFSNSSEEIVPPVVEEVASVVPESIDEEVEIDEPEDAVLISYVERPMSEREFWEDAIANDPELEGFKVIAHPDNPDVFVIETPYEINFDMDQFLQERQEMINIAQPTEIRSTLRPNTFDNLDSIAANNLSAMRIPQENGFNFDDYSGWARLNEIEMQKIYDGIGIAVNEDMLNSIIVNKFSYVVNEFNNNADNVVYQKIAQYIIGDDTNPYLSESRTIDGVTEWDWFLKMNYAIFHEVVLTKDTPQLDNSSSLNSGIFGVGAA